MVARFVRIEEVRGSIPPLSSTTEGRFRSGRRPSSFPALVVSRPPLSQRHPIRWQRAEKPGRLCDMEHRMSDDELRRAIRVLRERADTARHENRTGDAEQIEETIRQYQEEMAERL